MTKKKNIVGLVKIARESMINKGDIEGQSQRTRWVVQNKIRLLLKGKKLRVVDIGRKYADLKKDLKKGPFISL